MITLTNSAITKIKTIVAGEDNPNVAVRVYVAGGGCSGFSYGFTLDEEPADDDVIISADDVRVFVDAVSMQYLTGAEIDYKESITESRFVIKNPQATATCGCGSSFAI
jgi:iron-sulfur cluster insertion protein